jgi:hypothetical protein
VTRKLRRGRNVTEERKGDWQRRGGNPGTLSEFLHHRPSTTNEVSGLLGCSDDEVEAVLWAFGFAPDDEGLWRVAGDDDAKMLRAIWELIEYGYNRVELERRFRELGEAYAETAEGPIIDWDEELRQPDSQ